MNVSLNDLLNAQGYKRGALQFSSISNYIEPFLENLNGRDVSFRCEGQTPAELSVDVEGHENITYSRGLVEGVFKEEVLGHVPVVGLIYAFDKQNPVIKTYAGYRYATNDNGVQACMNLCIFGARNVFSIAATSNSIEEVYDKSRNYVNKFEEEVKEFETTIRRLKETVYEGPQYYEKLGQTLTKSIGSKLGHMAVVSAGKSMINAKSPYFSIGTDGEISSTAFNFYNAITQQITDSKSFDANPEKTLDAARLILN